MSERFDDVEHLDVVGDDGVEHFSDSDDDVPDLVERADMTVGATVQRLRALNLGDRVNLTLPVVFTNRDGEVVMERDAFEAAAHPRPMTVATALAFLSDIPSFYYLTQYVYQIDAILTLQRFEDMMRHNRPVAPLRRDDAAADSRPVTTLVI